MKLIISASGLVLFLLSSHVSAFEVLLGMEATTKSLWVEDTDYGTDEIARMDGGLNYYPSVSARSESIYFDHGGNWGYHYQFDFSQYEINTQEILGLSDPVDLGTRVKGSAFYAVPVGYYHFKKGQSDQWQYKAGLGIGVGYLTVSGDYQVTDSNHINYGEVKTVNVTGVDMAVGVYFEAFKGNHVVVIQNYAPTLESAGYQYMLHNVVIAYRYAFEILGSEQ